MIVKLFIPILAAALLTMPAKTDHTQGSEEMSITFTISNAGFDVTGSISAVQSAIQFDPKDLANSAVKISASPSSIHTGISMRDRHLQKHDYFDTEKYPLIVMRSKRFSKSGNGKIMAEFDLTIKDITRPVVVIFSGAPEGQGILYKGQFEINRLEFNLGEKSMILDELVKVNVEVVL